MKLILTFSFIFTKELAKALVRYDQGNFFFLCSNFYPVDFKLFFFFVYSEGSRSMCSEMVVSLNWYLL